MKTELVNVSPALAREWLKRNTKNRPLRPSHVETLRQAFARGEYVTTHQGIAFDLDDELVDGQHRLHAISLMPNGFSVNMLVTGGLDRERAFPVIDATQAKRSTSDVLRVDRSIGETANYLARLYSGSMTGLTALYVRPFADFVEVELGDLLAFCPTVIKTWSSAPVRAAAVLKMKFADPDYVKVVYGALVRRDFEAMPRSAQALFKAQMTGSVRASAANDIFVRSLKVFDRTNAQLTKIQINDIATELKEARDLINGAVFHSSRTVTSSTRARTLTDRRRDLFGNRRADELGAV